MRKKWRQTIWVVVSAILVMVTGSLVRSRGGESPVDRGAEMGHSTPDAPLAAATHVRPAATSGRAAIPESEPAKTDSPAKTVAPPVPPDPGDTAHQVIESRQRDFPDTPVGRQLEHHMIATEGMGPNAEAFYQESLEALRENPWEATKLLANAYHEMEEERYLDRWKVVDTLAELATYEALGVLSEIADQPVPEESLKEEDGFSAKAEEQMIRSAAIAGIEDLAARGVLEAETELFRLISHQDTTVRESVVLAYRRSGFDQQARVDELKEVLAAEDHWMLKLQEVADVRLMPQPSVQESDAGEANPEENTVPQVEPSQTSRGDEGSEPKPDEGADIESKRDASPPPVVNWTES